MRRLLLKLDYWWYDRSPARIRGLVLDVERLCDENHRLQARLTALESTFDLMAAGPGVPRARRHLASVTELRPAVKS